MPADPDRNRSTTKFLRDLSDDYVLTEIDIDRIARLYYDTSPNLWATVNRNGRIKIVNPTWERETGYSLAECRRMRFQDFFSEDAGHAAEILSHLVFEDWRGGRRVNLIRKDGSILIVGVRGEKFNGYDLAHLRLIDMTIRAALDEQLRKAHSELEQRTMIFTDLMQYNIDGVSAIDGDFKIIYQSPSMATMLGYTSEEMVGRSAFDFLAPESLTLAQELSKKFLLNRDTPTRHYLWYLHKDGRKRMLEIVAVNRLDSPSRCIIVCRRDVTEWRIAQHGTGGGNGERLSDDYEDLPERWK